MNPEDIYARITAEIERAKELQAQGKIGRAASDLTSTNLECANTLSEEVAEVQDEVIQLFAAIQGLQSYVGKAIRTVNDLESILFSWRLDPPERMEKLDEESAHLVRLRRKELKTELVQVGAVVVAWLMRLEAEDNRGKNDLRLRPVPEPM